MKKIFSTTSLIILTILLSCNTALASGFSDLEKQTDVFMKPTGLNTSATIGDIVSTIITSFLSLLGIIFILFMVYAGYIWMTAQGNEEDVKKAKNIIRNSIIGLIIVVAAYSITYFIFNVLGSAGIGGGGGNPIET